MARDDRPGIQILADDTCPCCPPVDQVTVDFVGAGSWPLVEGGGTTVCCLELEDGLFLGTYPRTDAVGCSDLEDVTVMVRREESEWVVEHTYTIFNVECEIVGSGGNIYGGPVPAADPWGTYTGSGETLLVSPGCL